MNDDRRYFLNVVMRLRCSLVKRWEIINELRDHLEDARSDNTIKPDVTSVFGSAASIASSFNRILVWQVRMRKALFYLFMTAITLWIAQSVYFELSLPRYNSFTKLYETVGEADVLACEGDKYFRTSNILQELGLLKINSNLKKHTEQFCLKPQVLSRLPASIRYQFQSVSARRHPTPSKHWHFAKLLLSCESNPNCKNGESFMLITLDQMQYPDPGVIQINVSVESWDSLGKVRNHTEHTEFKAGQDTEENWILDTVLAVLLVFLWWSLLLPFELFDLFSLIIKKRFFRVN